MPLIQYQVVDLHHWLTLSEFADLVTIAEMTPGPIAINAATFVGIKTGGISGAVIATLGCILPSCVIVLLLAFLFSRYREIPVLKRILSGLRPAVIGLVASAGLSVFVLAIWGEAGFSFSVSAIDFVSVILFAAALFLLRKFKINPIFVMILTGAVGGVIFLLV